MRALESMRARRLELVGRVGGVGDGNVFVDELWDVRSDAEEEGPLLEDVVFSIERDLGGVTPCTGPFGDSMGGDLIRVWAERLKNGLIRVTRTKTTGARPLTKSGRRTMKELAGRFRELLTKWPEDVDYASTR